MRTLLPNSTIVTLLKIFTCADDFTLIRPLCQASLADGGISLRSPSGACLPGTRNFPGVEISLGRSLARLTLSSQPHARSRSSTPLQAHIPRRPQKYTAYQLAHWRKSSRTKSEAAFPKRASREIFWVTLGMTLSRSYSEHIENIRPFVRRKTVLFNNFLIIKEPRMSAIDRQ